jgi:hypothetical protein
MARDRRGLIAAAVLAAGLIATTPLIHAADDPTASGAADNPPSGPAPTDNTPAVPLQGPEGDVPVPTAPAPAPAPPTSNETPPPANPAPAAPEPKPPPKATPEPPKNLEPIPKTAAISILGKKVKGPAGEDMGRVVDLLLDRDARPEAVVIDFGGFLGVGSRKIAIDWQLVRFVPDDPDAPVALSLGKADVQAAPEYKDTAAPPVMVGPPPAAPNAAR